MEGTNAHAVENGCTGFYANDSHWYNERKWSGFFRQCFTLKSAVYSFVWSGFVTSYLLRFIFVVMGL